MNVRRSLLCRVAAVLSVAVFAVSACTSSDASNSYTFSSATKLGTLIPTTERKKAENVSGDLLDGGTTSLSSSVGTVVLVNFWASWCGPCVAEAPQLDLLYRRIKSRGVQFLGVDTKDAKPNATFFVSTNKISYPILFDEQGATALHLGNIPGKLPFTVLIDKQGKVAAVYLGGLTTKDLQGSLDTLLAET